MGRRALEAAFACHALKADSQARRSGCSLPHHGVTIDQAFGGWAKADKDHFADGGSFDQIYTKK